MFDSFFKQLAVDSNAKKVSAETIGLSREGRPLHAYCYGVGKFKISLIAGCHADEPVGPRLLNLLIGTLSNLTQDNPLLTEFQWWIVPHVNPDGEAKNRSWYNNQEEFYDLATYLQHVVRELPGDDIEFGFPRDELDTNARPEPSAVKKWWESSKAPFSLHVSLHGMAFAAGPWFLIDPDWSKRSNQLVLECKQACKKLGYSLHDVERHGEKGFVRIEPGFSSRPNSIAMAEYFLKQNDKVTAQKFRPSSMETIRNLGGDALTLVSEMPLFITPEVGLTLGPPDPMALKWQKHIADWKSLITKSSSVEIEATKQQINREAKELGLYPMPIIDQMQLQWIFIAAGIKQKSKQ